MRQTFYFYDLETSGFNPKTARIMQFAGQRADMTLKPIGQPDNLLVKLSNDILPEPDAVLVHGISPRLTQTQGISEPELLKYLTSKVFTPGTIAVGFNNIRFDDEFIRYALWRNFYDPYEWHWKDQRGRWDLLDASRMVRALRPAGIEWPFAPDGAPSNRLELLSTINKIAHDSVHDALSDVRAMMALAQLIKSRQPRLFSYMLKLRDKKEVEKLATTGHPFVYVSGGYPSAHEKAAIAVMIAPHPQQPAAFVYDLRIDPTKFASLSPAELAKLWRPKPRRATQANVVRGADDYFPVKKLSYNKCPMVAPLGVLDRASSQRLKLDSTVTERNLKKLLKTKDFGDKIVEADKLLRPASQPGLIVDEQAVDGLLYDGFIDDKADLNKMRAVRAATADTIAGLSNDFVDERLKTLLPIYKARNFPNSLTASEQKWWQAYRQRKLVASGRFAQYCQRIAELLKNPATSGHRNLLKELEAYGQSLSSADPS